MVDQEQNERIQRRADHIAETYSKIMEDFFKLQDKIKEFEGKRLTGVLKEEVYSYIDFWTVKHFGKEGEKENGFIPRFSLICENETIKIVPGNIAAHFILVAYNKIVDDNLIINFKGHNIED